MKKIILCLTAVSLVLSIAACGGESEKSTPRYDKIDVPEMHPPMELPKYPEIDGSTSTITMHAAIRAYLTGAYFVDSHSQTYAALERLIPGSDDPADIILAVKYHDETLQDAKKRGAELVIAPIAKEGFVFIIHKDNPIDKLTKQQLKDIYSGKITNWKEVGGKDEEIMPFVRNWDSGSQTAMEEFMEGEPIVGEDDNVLFSMFLMLSRVEIVGSPGIGYNIYSWSMGQNLDSMGLKTVAVEGVAPSNKTLSDGSYPLMIYTYSYYEKSNKKGESLANWLLTAEGQSVIASAGYVGIFGEYSTDEMPDFNKDEYNATLKIEQHYISQGFSYDTGHFYCERLTDKEQTESYAGGKGKDVTVLFLVHFYQYESEKEYTRFIALTRENGGEFEVIGEFENPLG
ncbi:MAG: substrate-binding domain-containing protein [Oscillospiraceae bacterium]|nr:substrate-binding domain-containing protein [Oscillospiraceae bacterium]